MDKRVYGVFLTVMALMWAHLYLRMVRYLPWPMDQHGMFWVPLFFCVQLLPVVPFFHWRKSPWAMTAIFLVTGYQFYLWLGLLLREGVVLIAWSTSSALEPKFMILSSALVLLSGTAAALLGIATAWVGPRVKHVEVVLPRWPQALDGFKILQISDLHIGPLIQRPYVRRVVRKVMRQKPDLIAITGDLGDGDPAELGAALDALGELQAPLGVAYVTGNPEYYWGGQAWIAAVAAQGIEPLLNRGKSLALPGGHALWLGGLPDFTAARFIPAHKADLAAASPPAGTPYAARILLAHQPKSYAGVAEAGFDLMLCGHTHNGQTFPFNLLVGRFNPFSRGLNQVGSLQLYVNPGTGYWGPPLRLGVRSEITCLVLKAATGVT